MQERKNTHTHTHEMEFISRVIDGKQDTLSTKPVEFFQKGTAATGLKDAYAASAKEIRAVLARPMLALLENKVYWPEYVKHTVPKGMGVYCRNVKFVQAALEETSMDKALPGTVAAVNAALKEIIRTAPAVYGYLEQVYPDGSAALENAAREAVGVARMGAQGWPLFYWMAKKLQLWEPIADTVNVIHTFVGFGVSGLVEGVTMVTELLQLATNPTDEGQRFITKYALWSMGVKNMSAMYGHRLTEKTADTFFRRHISSYTQEMLPELLRVADPLRKRKDLKAAAGTHPVVETALYLVSKTNEEALRYVMDHLEWLKTAIDEVDDARRICFVCMTRSTTALEIAVVTPIMVGAEELKLLNMGDNDPKASSYDNVAAHVVLGGVPQKMKERVDNLVKAHEKVAADSMTRDDLFFASLINPDKGDAFVMQEQMDVLNLVVQAYHDYNSGLEGPPIEDLEAAIRSAFGRGFYDQATLELLFDQASMAVSRDLINTNLGMEEGDELDQKIAALIGVRGGKEEEIAASESEDEEEDEEGIRMARIHDYGVDDIIIKEMEDDEYLEDQDRQELFDQYAKLTNTLHTDEQIAAQIMGALRGNKTASAEDLLAALALLKQENSDTVALRQIVERIVEYRRVLRAFELYTEQLVKKAQKKDRDSEPSSTLAVYPEQDQALANIVERGKKLAKSLPSRVSLLYAQDDEVSTVDEPSSTPPPTFEDLKQYLIEMLPPKAMLDIQTGVIERPQQWIVNQERLIVESILGIVRTRSRIQAIKREFRRRVNKKLDQRRADARWVYILVVIVGVWAWMLFTLGVEPVSATLGVFGKVVRGATRYMGTTVENYYDAFEDYAMELTSPMVRYFTTEGPGADAPFYGPDPATARETAAMFFKTTTTLAEATEMAARDAAEKAAAAAAAAAPKDLGYRIWRYVTGAAAGDLVSGAGNVVMSGASKAGEAFVEAASAKVADALEQESTIGSIVRGVQTTAESIGTILQYMYDTGNILAQGAIIIVNTSRGIRAPNAELLNIFSLTGLNTGWRATGMLMRHLLQAYALHTTASLASLTWVAGTQWWSDGDSFLRALQHRALRPTLIQVNRLLVMGWVTVQIALYPVFVAYYTASMRLGGRLSIARITLFDIPASVEARRKSRMKTLGQNEFKVLEKLEKEGAQTVSTALSKLNERLDQKDERDKLQKISEGATRSEQLCINLVQNDTVELSQGANEEAKEKKKKREKKKKKKKGKEEEEEEEVDYFAGFID